MATLRGRRHALSEDLQESALSLTISPVSGRTRPDSGRCPIPISRQFADEPIQAISWNVRGQWRSHLDREP
jgi:hypothetical protein